MVYRERLETACSAEHQGLYLYPLGRVSTLCNKHFIYINFVCYLYNYHGRFSGVLPPLQVALEPIGRDGSHVEACFLTKCLNRLINVCGGVLVYSTVLSSFIVQLRVG